MALTPTRAPRIGNKKTLRRRILSSKLNTESSGDEDFDEQTSAKGNESQRDTDKEMASELSSRLVLENTSSSLQSKDESIKSVLRSSKRKRNLVESCGMYRTPSIKTPKTDNIYSIKRSKTIPEKYFELWTKERNKIIKKIWNISFLSSVSNFYYNNKNIKSAYLRTLKTRILDAYPSYLIDIEMNPSSFLNQKPENTDSVFFEVTSLVPGEDGEEDTMVLVYEAVLVKTNNVQSLDLGDTQWFPLLLHKGSEKIHFAFIQWLQASFGCYVSPKGLSAASLVWLSAVWGSGKCSNNAHGKFEERRSALKYLVRPPCDFSLPPPNDKGNFTVKVTVKSHELSSIWQKIKDDEDKFTIEEVEKFHYVVESFVEELVGIPKSMLQLQEIKTPCNYITTRGKVKMTCEITFHSFLVHLAEIFEMSCNCNAIKNNNDDDDTLVEEGEGEGEEEE